MDDNIELGFEDFADDLKEILKIVTDEKVHAKALLAGAVPIVNHAKILAPRGKTGRLVQSIGADYSDFSKTVRIGIGKPVSATNSSTGFYGRFQNDGWRPAGGRRVAEISKAGGRRLDKRSKRIVRKMRGTSYLNRAKEAQIGNAYTLIFAELKKALDN